MKNFLFGLSACIFILTAFLLGNYPFKCIQGVYKDEKSISNVNFDDKTSHLQKDKNTFIKSDIIYLKEAFKQLENKYPINLGTIGMLECPTVQENSLLFPIKVFGDEKIDSFYENNHDQLKESLIFIFFILNGQNQLGDKLAELLIKNNLSLIVSITTPSNKTFKYEIESGEIELLMDKNSMSPNTAMRELLKQQIEITNHHLPIVWGTNQSIVNTTNLGISAVMAENEMLTDIILNDNDIILSITTPESEVSIKDMKYFINLHDNDYILSLFAQDLNFKELITTCALAHVNLVFRYNGYITNDSFDIKFDYPLLCKYGKSLNYIQD